MLTPQFKVKIIGGKLVQVPDFNYLQEHWLNNARSFSTEPSTNTKRDLAVSRYGQFTGHLARNSLTNGAQGYFENQCRAGLVADNKKSQTSEMNLHNQKQNNKLQAEENRLKAMNETYQSVLDHQYEPRQEDYDEDDDMSDSFDTSLANQVRDCLKNVNKQKLAFALRAMRRLDPSDVGYISVRHFRDILLMHQIFIIGGTLEKLIEKYKSNAGKINYKKLWTFVTKSFDGSKFVKEIPDNIVGSDLEDAIKKIEQDLKYYAHQRNKTYDFTDITESFENCDRSRTNLLGLKEMRILCHHYLPINHESLETIFDHCDQQSNHWIHYRSFLQILTDAQPTYLPPINQRRDTYVIEKTIENNGYNGSTLQKTIKNNRYLCNAVDVNGSDVNNILEQERPVKNGSHKHEFAGSSFPSESFVNNSRTSSNMHLRNKASENLASSTDSPRRKWYESEESWRKRKEKPKPKRKSSRKTWERSEPVRSLRKSTDEERMGDKGLTEVTSSEDESTRRGEFRS